MGVGLTKTDAIFAAGTGLAALPAVSIGATAKEPLTEVFRLTNVASESSVNVSGNGSNGVMEVPTGNYVGSTLATALEERINQIRDPETGNTVGGVTVRYEQLLIISPLLPGLGATTPLLKSRVPRG